MTGRTVPLNESNLTTLDINGNGVAGVGPLTAREVWHPANVSVKVSTNVNEAEATIHVAPDVVYPPGFRDASQSASTGDSSSRINADTVRVGQKVWAVWTGGDTGAIATITVTGTKDI